MKIAAIAVAVVVLVLVVGKLAGVEHGPGQHGGSDAPAATERHVPPPGAEGHTPPEGIPEHPQPQR